MKICILMNPQAGPSTSNDHFYQTVREAPHCPVRKLEHDEDWDAIVADEMQGDSEMLAVAGGDGTVHAVINATLKSEGRKRLGIIPLGTGNDFCRTLEIPFNHAEAFAMLESGRVASLDAIRISGDRDGFLANAATGGFSGQVAAETTSEQKAAWGPFAYMRGAIGPLAKLPHFQLRLRFDEAAVETVDALNIVVANGRTAAGGVLVAPTANPEDGLLDVVIVQYGES